MNPVLKLLIRCALSLGAALFLTRFFLDTQSWQPVFWLTFLLVFMSYVLEYSRDRKR